jgi:putative endonuclease
MNTRLLGKWGEAQVADFLRRKGYTLHAVGYYTRFGEIDLIASNGAYLAFVEVKLRKNARFAQPREFVDAEKQRKIKTCAALYLSMHPTDLQPRFDVAEVYAPLGTKTLDPIVRYYEDAF